MKKGEERGERVGVFMKKKETYTNTYLPIGLGRIIAILRIFNKELCRYLLLLLSSPHVRALKGPNGSPLALALAFPTSPHSSLQGWWNWNWNGLDRVI